jgi:hypothetical protein
MDKSAMEYLVKLPDSVPEGKVLVHNDVYPVAHRPGMRGSRCWLMPPDPAHLELCGCDWAPELGQHYHLILTP